MADRLYFFSRSLDAYPGTGTREVVQDPLQYRALAAIRHWRKSLSNFSDDCVVVLDGASYRTIEHAFQAAKIGLKDQAAAARFALESGSELSRASGQGARKQRKMVVLNERELDVWARRQGDVLLQLWQYKATHCQKFREILLATQGAELWHVQNRKPAVRWFGLEDVRAGLLATLRD